MRFLWARHLVVHVSVKELPLIVGAAVAIPRLILTIVTNSEEALLPNVGMNMITHLLLVGRDITTNIVDLLLHAIAGM